MKPLPVVKDFDELKEGALGLGSGSKMPEIDQLCLQRVVEALHDGVIPAISLSAHGTPYLMTVQKVLKLFARVLAPTVGVMNQPRFGLATGESHFKGVTGQGLCHSFAHGPTNDLPAPEIEGGCQVKPALVGCNVGDVGNPDGIRFRRLEVPSQQIQGDRQVVT